MQPDEKDVARRKLYWQCQLGGWLGSGVLQVSPALLGIVARPGLASVLTLAVVRSIAGILTTHLFRLWILRRRWLQTVGRVLAFRLLAGVAVTAAGGTTVEWIFTRLFPPNDSWSRSMGPARVVQTWIAWVIMITCWTVLYVVIRELRERRVRELRALRLEMMVQQAQLQSLRAQLNPHFLFNCLNSLRAIIGENPDARQMVTQLSTLLRYSLQSSQSELVPIERELEVVRDYLALETIRFEERLRVEWVVDPKARSAQIPPMLLQVLVENALKHGVAKRAQGDDVAIHVRIHDGELRLEVLNSGSVEEGPPSQGVGLANARERIALLYGERASLVLENAPGGRVRAVVRLPLAPVEIPA